MVGKLKPRCKVCSKPLGRERRTIRIYADFTTRALIYSVITCSRACSDSYKAKYAETTYHVTELTETL